MKAVCKQTAAFGAHVIDAPIPKPADDQVLVKVRAASLCGTDLHIYTWDPWAAGRIKPPLIFGHEFSGEVVACGKNANYIRVGDHVSSETHIPCQRCYQCQHGQMHVCKNLKLIGVDRSGGFAEYVALPEICCVRNDKSLPWEIGSILEPFGNAVYAVSESEVAGKYIAIFGDGPIGIFATAIARAKNPEKILFLGMQPFRMELAKHYHPDHVIDVRNVNARETIFDLTNGEGVDVVLEMSGSPRAIRDGFQVLRNGGTFITFGIPSTPIEIDFANELIVKGITLKAIFGRKMFETWKEARRLVESGSVDLKPVITHEFPLERIGDAMALLTAPEIKAGKIVLRP